MSDDRDMGSRLCADVLDRLIDQAACAQAACAEEAADGGARTGESERVPKWLEAKLEPQMAEHLHSCVTCFRAFTELRDAPRLGAALRVPVEGLAARPDAEFWDQLATFTTDAAWRALHSGADRASAGTDAADTGGGARLARLSVDKPGILGIGGRLRQGIKRRHAWVTAFAATVAAAAGWLVVARPALQRSSAMAISAMATSERTARGAANSALDEEGLLERTDDTLDAVDLDGQALQRVLDRIQGGALGPWAMAGSGSAEVADLDDDESVSDELVDLDGPALLRVERSIRQQPWEGFSDARGRLRSTEAGSGYARPSSVR